ncbi:hypothetical protein PR048_023644 [Dryococelus australis]|uniref:Uncharacterized protein n=1 Tax=Dryococelus australis TaxID=614101 RepID=A0ABQ9GUP0_9NEOP|nr:hypothetical protein PR048_023644 [Dryococelus australis]
MSYINRDTFVTSEDILGFAELKSTTGIALKEAIHPELEKLALNYAFLCGQGCYGGLNMAEKFNCVQALILAQQPMPIHAMLQPLSKLVYFKSLIVMGTVGNISVFLSVCANRTNALQRGIADSNLTETNKTKSKTLWIEIHDTLVTFKELFIPIVTLHDEIVTSSKFDSETSIKACMYSSAIKIAVFLALETAAYCLSLTLELSEQLQSSKQDLSTALSTTTNTETEFGSIFEDASKIAEHIGSQIALPRSYAKLTRGNIPALNTEEYFRRAIFFNDN